MKSSDKAGFTIIETMLFLGITGLLVMGILVGAGTSINIQRYRDSVVSLQSVLQKQFSEVSNVSNESDGSLACGGSTAPRGQSDCVILGRYITTSNSRKLSIRSVIGNDYILGSLTNDIQALQNYNVQISPVGGEEYEIEWGASLTRQGAGGDGAFSILILRSPLSGIVRTFIDPNAVISDNEISSLISETALIQPLTVCVNSNGMFENGRSAIFITANTTNPSGVETLGEAISGC